jgi:hypothetical protein
VTLLAAYGFGGSGSTIVDDSGNGRNFTLDANTVRGGGGLTRLNNGTTTGPALTGLQTSLRSITCQINRSSTSQDGWFPGIDSSGTGIWGLIDLGGQRQCRGRNSGGAAAAQQAAATGLHALGGTYDGTNLRLYVDGALAATTALTSPLRTDGTSFCIFITTGTETVMKDLRLYDHVLTLSEIQADGATPVTPLGAATKAPRTMSQYGSFY